MTLGASELMVRGFTVLGARFGFSEGLLGLLTAVGADAPELSSAVVALVAGSRAVSVGVVLGSNLFNLAALLGLSAVVSGGLHLHRAALLLDGAIGLLAVALAGALMAGWLPAWVVAVLLAAVFGLYASILSLRPAALRRLRVRGPLLEAVVLAPGHVSEAASPGVGRASLWPAALLPLAVAGVIGGSLGLVRSALSLASTWHVPAPVTGGLVLAVLTSLPNAYAAVSLGRRGRGTAVLSEAMNSNTINLLGGLVLPAAIVGMAAAGADPAYWWLIALMLLALALPLWRHRLGRAGGLVVIAGYLAFVGYTLAATGPGSR